MQSIFVSSTFHDMQLERDLLHRRIIPALRAVTAEYGKNIDLVDLRWGISTSELDQENANKRILSVCMEEIKKCNPFIIVLLGDRYGWIPDDTLMQMIYEEDEKTPFCPSKGISITELEISYAMWLNRIDLSHCIFCFRTIKNPEDMPDEMKDIYMESDPDKIKRLQNLKKKIEEIQGVNILKYELTWNRIDGRLEGENVFEQEIENQLKNEFNKLWSDQRNLANWERQRLDDQRRQDELINGAVLNQQLTSAYWYSCQGKLFILLADSGSGKSTSLAYLHKEMKRIDVKSEIIYCGNSAFCMNGRDLVKILIACLKYESGVIHDECELPQDDDRLLNIWYDLAETYEGDSLYLIIDGVDLLERDLISANQKFLPPVISDHLHLIISGKGEVFNNPYFMELTSSMSLEELKLQYLPNPDIDEWKSILSARLLAEHKQLSPSVFQRIVDKVTGKKRLYLMIVFRWLAMLDERNFTEIRRIEQTEQADVAIDSYISEFLRKMPDELDDIICSYIDAVADYLCNNESEKMKMTLMILALGMSKGGMSRTKFAELERFLQTGEGFENIVEEYQNWWDESLFIILKRYLKGFLSEKEDGSISFSSPEFRKALYKHSKANIVAKLLSMWICKKIPLSEPWLWDNYFPLQAKSSAVDDKNHFEYMLVNLEEYVHELKEDSSLLHPEANTRILSSMIWYLLEGNTLHSPIDIASLLCKIINRRQHIDGDDLLYITSDLRQAFFEVGKKNPFGQLIIYRNVLLEIDKIRLNERLDKWSYTERKRHAIWIDRCFEYMIFNIDCISSDGLKAHYNPESYIKNAEITLGAYYNKDKDWIYMYRLGKIYAYDLKRQIDNESNTISSSLEELESAIKRLVLINDQEPIGNYWWEYYCNLLIIIFDSFMDLFYAWPKKTRKDIVSWFYHIYDDYYMVYESEIQRSRDDRQLSLDIYIRLKVMGYNICCHRNSIGKKLAGIDGLWEACTCKIDLTDINYPIAREAQCLGMAILFLANIYESQWIPQAVKKQNISQIEYLRLIYKKEIVYTYIFSKDSLYAMVGQKIFLQLTCMEYLVKKDYDNAEKAFSEWNLMNKGINTLYERCRAEKAYELALLTNNLMGWRIQNQFIYLFCYFIPTIIKKAWRKLFHKRLTTDDED